LVILFISFTIILTTLALWWRDVSREATLGQHSTIIKSILKTGIVWFIAREVIFFFGFFWTYYWYTLDYNNTVGASWPPIYINVQTIYPYGIPLLNSLLLLTSGGTVTWAHYSFFEKNHTDTLRALVFTLALAVIFTSVQVYEYYWRHFSISYSTFGNCFFSITGLHGLHVVVGSIILTTSIKRIITSKINSLHHVNFELSIWYWHFVDIVWLLVFLRLYW